MIIESERTPSCATVDPELFFPKMPNDKQQRENILAAKEICKTCPVIDECLKYALNHGVEGIWAGTTFEERKQTRRKLGIVVDPILSGLCKRGHVRAGHNVYVNRLGYIKCRKCNAMDKAKKATFDE